MDLLLIVLSLDTQCDEYERETGGGGGGLGTIFVRQGGLAKQQLKGSLNKKGVNSLQIY
jgi:hypothetical protein